MLRTLRITIREGISLVEIGENLNGILLGTQIGKHPVEMLLDIQRAHLDLIAIKSHEIGLHTKGTGLVQTATTAGSAQLTQIGDVHLAQRIEVQII